MRIATVRIVNEQQTDRRRILQLPVESPDAFSGSISIALALDCLGFENPEPWAIQSITYSEEDGL
jgi:hypothetical protein